MANEMRVKQKHNEGKFKRDFSFLLKKFVSPEARVPCAGGFAEGIREAWK